MNKNGVMKVSQWWQLAFFSAVHIIIFSTLFHTLYTIQYSGTGLYFNFANQVMHGSLPYRDFQLEYPPFALFFFILPRIFAADYVRYAVLYGVEVVIFILIGLFVINDIAIRIGRSPWKMLTVYTIAVLAMGPITGQQYDIFPAVLTLLAIYCFWRGKHEISWGLLALGTLAKIYPIVLAPLFLIYYIRNRQYRNIWSGPITFVITCLVVLLPFLILNPHGLWSVYTYHDQRGIQLESTYSSFLLLANKLGLVTEHSTFGFGSWNISGSIESSLAIASTFILIFFLVMVYLHFYASKKNKAGKPDILQIGTYSLMAVLAVLITSKILSPQYLIWLIPLLPFVKGKWSYAIWGIFIVIGGLTYFIFPHYYSQLINFYPLAVASLLARNILLILLTLLCLASLRAQKSF